MDDYDTNQKEFFSGWKVERLIGIGGFGKVYKISKNITSKHKIYSAAKVITIPSDEEKRNIDLIYSTENDDTKAKYVEKMVEKITSEISLLYLLRGHSNIINYEDHSIEKKKDENSWDIIIKMEYAKSLNDYIGKKQLSLEEIIKIGIDITESLSFCESNNIIHR
ncbi:MAG: protein kinase, partial [Clostridiales bacterium]